MMGPLPASLPAPPGYAALALGAPTLTDIYVDAVLRLTPRLDLLAPAGSMQRTGYVAQGLVAGELFHFWGLALFGTLGNAALLGLADLIWGVVTVAATIWQLQ